MKKTGIIEAMMLCREYDKMNAKDKQDIRDARFREIVNHARTHSPYYQNLYDGLPQKVTLKDLPTTNKKTLMKNFDQWITDREVTLDEVEDFLKDTENIGRKFRRKYMVFTTSGSTGEPLIALYDPTANNIMGGITACRSYARKEDLKAFIKQGGKTIGVFADGGFYLSNNSVRARQRSMPWKKKKMAVTSALQPVDQIVEQLNRFQPTMLGGYPSCLELLIEEAKEGRLRISPVIIMTGGEYLSDMLRQKLAETFHCYVQTSYSCTEAGSVACECTHRHFHINEDWLIVEPVDEDGNPVPDGVQSNKLYLTNLYNYTQPFIRYELTDRVVMHHTPCPCGNPAPWLELEGRTDDMVTFTAEGKEIRIAPLPLYAVLKEVRDLRRFQLLVYPDNCLELRLDVKDGAVKHTVFERAKTQLETFLASHNIRTVNISLSEDQPMQDPGSGKYKHIIHRLPNG